MTERITKSMARNIYLGGGLFAILVFAGLTMDTVSQVDKRSNAHNLTPSVAHGKHLWEVNNCVGCHTIMGEGAYYAPELANVYDRYGQGSEEGFKAYMRGWMAAQPMQEPGRRKMPQFNLSDKEVDDISNFLIWTSKIDDNEWPPNKEG